MKRCACGQELNVRPEDASRRIRCRACGRIIEPRSPTIHRSSGRTLGTALVILGVFLVIAAGAMVSTATKPEASPLATPAKSQESEMAVQLASAELPPTSLTDSMRVGLQSCAQLAEAGRIERPVTGHLIGRGRSGGMGILEIENGAEADAVALLRTPAGRDVRRAFVRAGTTLRLNAIPEGTYELLFASGADWTPELNAFCRSRSYSRFSDTFTFTELEEWDGVRYSQWSVTLYPVAGGDARTERVDPALFAPQP